mgnify:CR=1 FL=1
MIVFKKGEEAELLKSLEDIHHSQGRFYGTYFSQKKRYNPGGCRIEWCEI